MRVCIFGAGAVGGNLAARLHAGGHQVAVVARGTTLAAIRRDGLTLIAGDRTIRAAVNASDDPAELGPQDVVISTLKAHQLPAFAAGIAPLLGEATPVIVAHNGIPYWYHDATAALLDPGGALRGAIDRARLLGGVIQSANDSVAPGVVENRSPNRNLLTIAEVDGRTTDRVTAIRQALIDCGIGSPPVADLGQSLWSKLIANLSVSVPAFLVERTSREVFDDPALGPVGAAMADELRAVAAAHGVVCDPVRPSPAPGHVSSMLQDYRLGRPQETTALIDAPLLLARAAGVATPVTDTIAALVSHKVTHPPSL